MTLFASDSTPIPTGRASCLPKSAPTAIPVLGPLGLEQQSSSSWRRNSPPHSHCPPIHGLESAVVSGVSRVVASNKSMWASRSILSVPLAGWVAAWCSAPRFMHKTDRKHSRPWRLSYSLPMKCLALLRGLWSYLFREVRMKQFSKQRANPALQALAHKAAPGPELERYPSWEVSR